MKHRVKFRIKMAAGEPRKFSINIEDGTSFSLGNPAAGIFPPGSADPAIKCSLAIRNGELFVEDHGSTDEMQVNGRPGKDFPIRQGDLLQIGGTSVEFLDLPTPPKPK